MKYFKHTEQNKTENPDTTEIAVHNFPYVLQFCLFKET